MTDQNHLPSLSFLFGSYFHLDFKIVTGTPEQTTECFLRDNPDLAPTLAQEAKQAIASKTEKELAEAARSMGACYRANWDGGTCREWFASIEAQARAFAAAHPQTPGPHEPESDT